MTLESKKEKSMTPYDVWSGKVKPDDDEPKFKRRIKNYNSGTEIFLVSIINIAAIIISIIIIIAGKDSNITWWENFSKFNTSLIGFVIFLLQLFYTFESLRTVQLGEQGVLLFLGGFLKDVKPGFVYVPLWICTLTTAPTTNIEDELPADPELIYHGDPARGGDGSIPDGKFAPIRVTFAGTAPEDHKDKEDAYGYRLTAEVAMPFSYKIYDLKAFIENIGDLNKARGQMGDTAVGVFVEAFSNMTAAKAMTSMEDVAKDVKRELGTLTEPWGIEIVMVRFKPFGFSHGLNEAVSARPAAIQKKLAKITESEGDAQVIKNIGDAKGEAEYKLISGRARGNDELAKIAKTPEGQFAMTINAAQEAAANRNFALIGDNNLIGGLLGLREVADRVGGNKPPTIPPAKSEETPKKETSPEKPKGKSSPTSNNPPKGGKSKEK